MYSIVMYTACLCITEREEYFFYIIGCFTAIWLGQGSGPFYRVLFKWRVEIFHGLVAEWCLLGEDITPFLFSQH